MRFLIPPHPLTNFEIQNYYQNEPRFNGVHSRNNLTAKLNLPGIHWVALFCNKKQVI